MIRRMVSLLAVATAIAIFSFAACAAAPVQLRFGYPNPPESSQYTDFILPWTQKVNKEAGGMFKIHVYAGESLLNMRDTLDDVENGVAEIGFCVLGPVSRQFPQMLVATLPSAAPNARDAGLALQRLYDQGLISDEWQSVKPLAFGVCPDLSYHTVPMIKTLADLKGLKISVQGRIAGETLEALGGVPITLPITDVYEALQNGTIEGTAISWPAVAAFHLTDIVKHHLLEPLGAEDVAIIMNKSAYARLPHKAQQVIDANSGTFLTNWFNTFIDHSGQQSINGIEHMKGQTVIKLSPKERAIWMKKIQPVIALWEKQTPDGAKVLAAFRKQVAAVASGS